MSVSRTLFFLAGLALARIAEAGTLYAVDVINRNIYTLDKATGAATLIGPTGQILLTGGMTFDTSTRRLIVSNLVVPGSEDAGRNVVGNGSTAPGGWTLTPPSDYVFSSSILSLAYHAPSDTLYGLSTSPFQLQTIDRTTGASSIGPVPLPDPPILVDLQAITFSPDGATLYGLSRFAVHRVDRTTGQITTIGLHGLNPAFLGFGFTVDPDDGTYYVSTATGSTSSILYRLNPATGQATLIGPLNISTSALAVVGSSTAEVPALGPAGLVGLALLLAGMGAVLSKRRFATARATSSR